MAATVVYLGCGRVVPRLRNDKNNNNPHAQVRKLSKRFGMFHGITNLLNLVALACGCVHLCALAGRLGL